MKEISLKILLFILSTASFWGVAAKSNVVLEHAETLSFDKKQKADCQVLKGNVRFRHEGALLFCDSAYFYTNDMVSDYDRSLYESKVNYDKAVQSSVVIFKDGEIYAGLNPDADSMKSDEDVKNWLSKYIDIE